MTFSSVTAVAVGAGVLLCGAVGGAVILVSGVFICVVFNIVIDAGVEVVTAVVSWLTVDEVGIEVVIGEVVVGEVEIVAWREVKVSGAVTLVLL